ncbi:hypothetical protein SAMN06269185_2344 [Natronoarchaeum philippinense]|uniref:Uncharacterized protein n=1 Tax=Natronoarchaeum philippinense TaxID=558529 RepID=A0A285NZS8_NATPI|nr:hypothetical protein [Natronoarchaeum philippinense]SNZ15002.1 hypothetical protein SAMN06269185_2344 [Natronoarchaeum philippinense]
MVTENSSAGSLSEVSPLKALDLMTQPRFLLPTAFPFIVYLGWTMDSSASLSAQLLAALGIALGGWFGAMAVEYQPFVPLEDGTINEIQGGLLFVVAAVIYGVWSYNAWPAVVQGFGLVSGVAVALWLPARRVLNLSGGVIFPTALFVFLTLQDLRLAPLLVVLAIRVPVALTIEDLSPLETTVGLTLGSISVLTVLALTPLG